MQSIGIRCGSDGFWFVVAVGTRGEPELVLAEPRKCPHDMTRACSLNWIRKEIQGVLALYKAKSCRLKAVEPFAPKNVATLHRAEVEGVIQAAIYDSGCKDIKNLYKSQLKSVLAYEGPIRTIEEKLASSPFENLHGKELREAALAAWAALEE
jgi:hypothetical protein